MPHPCQPARQDRQRQRLARHRRGGRAAEDRASPLKKESNFCSANQTVNSRRTQDQEARNTTERECIPFKRLLLRAVDWRGDGGPAPLWMRRAPCSLPLSPAHYHLCRGVCHYLPHFTTGTPSSTPSNTPSLRVRCPLCFRGASIPGPLASSLPFLRSLLSPGHLGGRRGEGARKDAKGPHRSVR